MRIGILIAAMMFAAASAFAQTPAPVGTVSKLQGAATVTHTSAGRIDTAQGLKIGTPIFLGDILETAAGAKLLVAFNDGTQLTLGPKADVVIDEFVYNPTGGAAKAALRVTGGAMRLVAGAVERIGGAAAITVGTPVGSIGIRGTDFFIEMEDDHLSVALFSGYEITVTNGGGQTVLWPGEGTDVYNTVAPSRPLVWNADRVNRALDLVTLTTATRP
jgi:hypothetical protein